MSDLNEVKASAEKVLGGSDSGEAQQLARHVLYLLELVKETKQKYTLLEASINGELAQLKAEAGDLETQKARTKDAENKATELSSKAEALAKENEHLKQALTILHGVAEAVRAGANQVDAALKGV